MSSKPLHVGIDLGTTHSTAAVFDGETISLVRNNQGSPLTPSVVRLDARGIVSVGARARKFLETDPENTRAEFKRLMGTDQLIGFAASGRFLRPEDLAAEVLKSLRNDVREQFGIEPENAVICVPALFEIPQSSATSSAARLAGFKRVELLQEPVASALAAGWRQEETAGKWLVFDLGAGTFDVSLLETQEGMLRVIGHDGDNFLGGRDIDLAIVDWVLAEAGRESGKGISRSDPEQAATVRRLKFAAEEAKIELSRAQQAPIAMPDLGMDFLLTREDLDRLAGPLVDRAIEISRRLLAAHRTKPVELRRVVLVGGPTAMPILARRVREGLNAPVAEGLDPFALVAMGAAIYAASAGLDARPPKPAEPKSRALLLQFPVVSSDLKPYVVGKVLDTPDTAAPARIRLARDDGQWKSEFSEVAPDCTFTLSAELVPRRTNAFTIEAQGKDGKGVPVHPPGITIVQGLTITDPPLSRSIGVALADDRVRTFVERGDPLPARKTVTLSTIESVAKGCKDSLLKIPIVQGEFDNAHLCRLVGALEIPGDSVQGSLPAGSPVEVTLEVDRGGKLSARAFVPALSQVFEGVAHLVIPYADVESLQEVRAATTKHAEELLADARRRGDAHGLEQLAEAKLRLQGLDADLAAARGGDADAAQKARRALLEVDATLEEVEAERKWPELEERAKRNLIWASGWVEKNGTAMEKTLFAETSEAVQRARTFREAQELERQLRLIVQLGNRGFYRDPGSWERMFDDAAGDMESARDLPKARKLVEEGRKARAKKDSATLKRVTRELWGLYPPDAQQRRLGFDSGVQ